MAAAQIRLLAERDGALWPAHSVAEFRHIADQCDREADELQSGAAKG
jgi:hypothetical protein